VVTVGNSRVPFRHELLCVPDACSLIGPAALPCLKKNILGRLANDGDGIGDGKVDPFLLLEITSVEGKCFEFYRFFLGQIIAAFSSSFRFSGRG
jgi:hypothetical protein